MSKSTYKLVDSFKKYDLILILLLLVTCNFLLRWIYDLQFNSLPYYFDQLQLNYQDSKWYTYMFPSMAKVWGGTWSSLGIGLFPVLKQFIGNTTSYFLLNSLFIITAYGLSWFAFRSKILTVTVGICTAFTTLNYHVYQNSSLIIIYIPFIFCFLNLFALYKLFQEDSKKIYWWLLWGISLALYILSFEGWLDYYAVTLMVSPFCFYLLYRQGDLVRTHRLIKIISILTVTCLAYIICKVKYGYASSKGTEHDLIFNYGKHYIPLMIEDIIGNFFTFFYTTIITYIPPIFTFSFSYMHYGPSTLIALQNGYDPSYTYMASINALLLWRFYAGIYFSIFSYFFFQVIRRLLSDFKIDYFFIFLFMFMIVFGAPCHFLVKFRPFHITPWLAYQEFMGQIGLIMLIAYALSMLHKIPKIGKKYVWVITLAIWSSIITCAFLKYSFYDVGVNSNYGFSVS